MCRSGHATLRGGHSCHLHQKNSQMWLFGGTRPGSSATELYFVETGQWDYLYRSNDPFDSPPVLPIEVADHCAVLHQDKLYIYGGRKNAREPVVQFERLNIPQNDEFYGGRYAKWDELDLIDFEPTRLKMEEGGGRACENSHLPGKRLKAGSLLWKNQMFIHGGGVSVVDSDWYTISLPPRDTHAWTTRPYRVGCAELSLREICRDIINDHNNRHLFPLTILQERLSEDLLTFLLRLE